MSQSLTCFHLKLYRELEMNGMVSVYLRLHEGSNHKWTMVFFNGEYNQTFNSWQWFHVFQVSWQKYSCRAMNRLMSDVIICRSRATHTTANDVFDPFKPCQRLICNSMPLVRIVTLLLNNAMEPVKRTIRKIYRLKFILKQHVFVMHVVSVITGSVQATHRAVGARTMHCFGTGLVKNRDIWLVESLN